MRCDITFPNGLRSVGRPAACVLALLLICASHAAQAQDPQTEYRSVTVTLPARPINPDGSLGWNSADAVQQALEPLRQSGWRIDPEVKRTYCSCDLTLGKWTCDWDDHTDPTNRTIVIVYHYRHGESGPEEAYTPEKFQQQADRLANQVKALPGNTPTPVAPNNGSNQSSASDQSSATESAPSQDSAPAAAAASTVAGPKIFRITVDGGNEGSKFYVKWTPDKQGATAEDATPGEEGTRLRLDFLSLGDNEFALINTPDVTKILKAMVQGFGSETTNIRFEARVKYEAGSPDRLKITGWVQLDDGKRIERTATAVEVP